MNSVCNVLATSEFENISKQYRCMKRYVKFEPLTTFNGIYLGIFKDVFSESVNLLREGLLSQKKGNRLEDDSRLYVILIKILLSIVLRFISSISKGSRYPFKGLIFLNVLAYDGVMHISKTINCVLSHKDRFNTVRNDD